MTEGPTLSPVSTDRDNQRRQLHCEDGAEPGLALHDTLVSLRSLGQWVRLDYRFNFPLCYEIKGFVEIFGTVLLASNDANTLRDEVHQRNCKRLCVRTHSDKPAVRPQSLNAVHHGLCRIGGAEDNICAARRGKALSVADNFIRAEIADQLVFVGGVRNCDGLETCSFRILHCQVPKSTDPEHGHALVRLGIRPAEPAIDRVTGAEDRGCLLVGNLVWNQIGGVGVHRHVLGVSALCIEPRTLQIGTEHSAAALAPFAASARGLNPCGADAIAYLSRGDVGSHDNDLADRLVTEDAGKWAWNVSECFVHVGIADAACAHFHQHLTGSGLRLRNILDLPRTAHCGNDRSFHGLSSWNASMRVPLCWAHDFTSPTANRTHTLRLTVS